MYFDAIVKGFNAFPKPDLIDLNERGCESKSKVSLLLMLKLIRDESVTKVKHSMNCVPIYLILLGFSSLIVALPKNDSSRSVQFVTTTIDKKSVRFNTRHFLFDIHFIIITSQGMIDHHFEVSSIDCMIAGRVIKL